MGRKRPADMIAADTCALLAIVFNEPERAIFLDTIRKAESALVSTICHQFSPNPDEAHTTSGAASSRMVLVST